MQAEPIFVPLLIIELGPIYDPLPILVSKSLTIADGCIRVIGL